MREQAERRCDELREEKDQEIDRLRNNLSVSMVNERLTHERIMKVNASWEDSVSKLEVKASEASSRSLMYAARLTQEEALASIVGPQDHEETVEMLERIDKAWRAELAD